MTTLHKIVYACVRPAIFLYAKLKFGFTYERARDLPETYIVMANHTTDFDAILVALSFPRHMYFVASEHVARWGFASKLLMTFLAPILRPKGSVAAGTVKDILRKLKSGHNVCLFAEGAKSWDGRSCPILPSTGKMVKSAKCGMVTYKLTGGYFAQPRWCVGATRKGYFHGAVEKVYTAEQIAAMSADEVNAIIRNDLWEDAYERQLADPKPYRCKTAAEKLENLLFICPECGGHDTLHSQGDTVKCESCGLTFRYNEYGMLEGAPFTTVREFSDWQNERIVQDAAAGMTYTGAHGTLSTVGTDDSEILVGEGPLAMSPEELRCGEAAIALDTISSMDIHGRNGIVFTAESGYYEFKPRDNAIKFLLLFHHYANKANEKR